MKSLSGIARNSITIRNLFTSHSSPTSLIKHGNGAELFASSRKENFHSAALLSFSHLFPSCKITAAQNLPSRCFCTSVAEYSTAQHTSVSIDSPLIKFKRLDKTARHIMQILDKEAVEEVHEQRAVPDLQPGHIIQLKVEVPENKRRVSILKGIVIARRNAGLNTTFRLRRLVAGVGIESLFPL